MKTIQEYISDIRQQAALVDAAIGWFDESDIERVMQEYAKQESIEFGKWIMYEFEPSVFDEDENKSLYAPIYQGDYPEKSAYSIQELYKIWKEDTK